MDSLDVLPRELSDVLCGANRSAIEDILEMVDPLALVLGGVRETAEADGYCALRHSQICRFKMLGLADNNAARAAGVTPQRLKKWLDAHPRLRDDMERSAQLVNAEVAAMLFKLMTERGPVGLNAVKYYLSTHAEEFKERAELAVRSSADNKEIRNAVRAIYGIDIEHLDDGIAPDLNPTNVSALSLPTAGDS